MQFTRVLSSDALDHSLRLDLQGTDGKRYTIEMPQDVALQVITALRQAAKRLPPVAQHQEVASTLFRLRSCQPLMAPGSEGLALTTEEGFEVPLLLDRPAQDALRACIDQLGSGKGSVS
ncbi:MAG: hypothetical protein Q8O42_09465 [Acidobacteriota bacterium]|nr:hypothetical protein [Acidobacteriota bacterium]